MHGLSIFIPSHLLAYVIIVIQAMVFVLVLILHVHVDTRLHFILTNHQKDTKRQTVRVDTCYLILYIIEDNISKIKTHNSVLFSGVQPVLMHDRDH